MDKYSMTARAGYYYYHVHAEISPDWGIWYKADEVDKEIDELKDHIELLTKGWCSCGLNKTDEPPTLRIKND
jgi:hypothetical protein